VQGARTLGITERPGAAWLDSLRREFGFDPPETHGLDAVDAIRAMHAGRVRVFLALGGNLLSASPDTAYTVDALRRCRLTMQISTKLNRAHLVTGRSALILPTLGRSEADRQPAGLQFVTCENSMSVVQPSMGKLRPASPALRSEVRIVADLAAASLDSEDNLDWPGWADDYGRIRARIEAMVPGFEAFADRLERDGQLVLPNPVRDERRFDTADGRARFLVHGLPDCLPGPGRYLMMTIRSHDQFNTAVYTDEDRYRGISGSRQVVFMAMADMAAAGLAADDRVVIVSHHGDQVRRLAGFAVVPSPRRTRWYRWTRSRR